MSDHKNAIQKDYIKRIDKVFAFIDQNLGEELSLDTVSRIAHFSPFHFHRIFKSITGETLNEYITRRRIEKAAADLIHKELSITEISLRNGFNDNSTFTRSFKKFYGLSPTDFKSQNPNKYGKIRQLKSKIGQVYPDHEKYLRIIDNLKKWINMNAEIQIKELPEMKLAYVSSLGSQNLANAYQKLMQWAIPKGLVNETSKTLTIYHESLKVTEEERARMSACLVLNQPVETTGEVGLTTIRSGRYIVGRLEITLDEFTDSWTGLHLWMNENGYSRADGNAFEIYHNDYREHPENKFVVDFCIPIE